MSPHPAATYYQVARRLRDEGKEMMDLIDVQFTPRGFTVTGLSEEEVAECRARLVDIRTVFGVAVDTANVLTVDCDPDADVNKISIVRAIYNIVIHHRSSETQLSITREE